MKHLTPDDPLKSNEHFVRLKSYQKKNIYMKSVVPDVSY
jgi:hypothetical protein